MLQCSSAHTVSSLCMCCSFPNTAQYSSTHTVSCYSTVQHTQCHVTVQFSTHCIISLYELFLSQHCTVQFNTQFIMLQYSSTHTVSCYTAVRHTIYHISVCTFPFPTLYSTVQHIVSCYSTVQHTECQVTVQFSTDCIISLYVLFLSQHCTVQFNTHCIMLQYSSTHTMSCYSAVQHTLYQLSVCPVLLPTLYSTFQYTLYNLSVRTVPFPTLYSTVQHTLCHVTVQFSAHSIMLQYSSLHTFSCYRAVQHTLYHLPVSNVPFPTLYNTFQYTLYNLFLCTVPFPTLYSTVQHTLYHITVSSTHTVPCYNTVQHKLYHVTVHFNTHNVLLQCSSAHTVSSLCMYCSFSNTVQYSSSLTVSCYSTVQHKQCPVTVQFGTPCIISPYVLFLSQHRTVQFNTHCIMLQYSSTHAVSCYSTVQHILYHLSLCIFPFPTLYSTVQHTLYHVTVQFNTHSVMLQCSSAQTVSSVCMYCSFTNTVQYSSAHNV